MKEIISSIGLAAYVKQQLSPENIKAHITLVNNRPVVDRQWFLQVFSAAVASSGGFRGKKLIDYVVFFENWRKTVVNLEYQEIYGEFLDKIDSKLQELDKKLEGFDDLEMACQITEVVMNQLYDEFLQIDREYERKYSNSIIHRFRKFIGG